MNQPRAFLAIISLLLASSANAEVFGFLSCQLNPSKSWDDLFEERKQFRGWAESEGIVLGQSQILFEFFGNPRPENGFFELVIWPNFEFTGKVIDELWDNGSYSRFSDEVMGGESAASCDQSRILWSPTEGSDDSG